MGALVTKEYANELLEELKKAAEINPAMFNQEKIKTFYEDLYGTGDQGIRDVFAALDHVYEEEIRFTDEEYAAIRQLVEKHGFEILEEYKKEPKEEAKARLGDAYNPVRDDYSFIGKLGDKEFVFHVFKMKKKNGGFLVDAKKGLIPEYGINQFCANEKTTKHFFTTPAVQFIMLDYNQSTFKDMLNNLNAGLNLKQFEQNNEDDFYRTVSALEDLEYKNGKGKRGKVRSRLTILKKYEESLVQKKTKAKKKRK